MSQKPNNPPEKDQNKEVKKEQATHAIILRAQSYDTAVCFYATLDDALWAMGASWFDPKDAILTKILPWKFTVIERSKGDEV